MRLITMIKIVRVDGTTLRFIRVRRNGKYDAMYRPSPSRWLQFKAVSSGPIHEYDLDTPNQKHGKAYMKQFIL